MQQKAYLFYKHTFFHKLNKLACEYKSDGITICAFAQGFALLDFSDKGYDTLFFHIFQALFS